ncbi:MAG: hypothetical protein PVF63_01085 [Gammaproteobacteria bacterium]
MRQFTRPLSRCGPLTAVALLLVCLPVTPSIGQSDDAPAPVHWAYAAFFGSGRYEFGGAPGVRVFRFDVRRNIRAPAYHDGTRTAGITLRIPVTLGRQEDAATGRIAGIGAGTSTISAVPGVEFPIPIGERWSIKPLANVGYGHATRGGDSAWIYRAGLRSRFTFDSRRFDWALVSALSVIGFRDDRGYSQRALPLTLGLDARIGLRNRRLGDDAVFLHWHVARTHYLDEPVLLRDPGAPALELDGEWELGAAFSKGEKRLRLKRLSWDRVGLALRITGDADLAGVRLVFRSLFDR